MNYETHGAKRLRLCSEWRRAQGAANSFPLFERGQMRLDRIGTWNLLCAEEEVAKARLDLLDNGPAFNR